jgi:hypothetical protein
MNVYHTMEGLIRFSNKLQLYWVLLILQLNSKSVRMLFLVVSIFFYVVLL